MTAAAPATCATPDLDDDRALLAAYATRADPTAFATLVRRHADLVYNACLRQARGDRHLADDATQAVFLLLAQRAGRLGPTVLLTGWLYNTARYAAANAVRAENRRRRHERRAATAMPTATPPAGSSDAPTLDELAPILDAAVNRLPTTDRDAILLRYFEDKPLREVATALAISEDAAKKRCARAVEKLRQVFTARGLPTTAIALAAILPAANSHAAPPAVISAACGLALPATATAPIAALAKSTFYLAQLKSLAATIAISTITLIGATAATLLLAAPPAPPQKQTAIPVLAQAPAAPSAPSPYHIVYANGVTLDVLAVSVIPSRNRPFWSPDGSRLVDPPYDARELGTVGAAAARGAAVELTVRISGLADAPIVLRPRTLNGVRVGPTRKPYRADGSTADDLMVFECAAPAGADTLDFDLACAANTWQTVRAFKGLGTFGDGPDKITVIPADPERNPQIERNARFRVDMLPHPEASHRLIAIDTAGVTHVSSGDSWHGGNVAFVIAVFPADLTEDKVREYRLQRCDFETQRVTAIHLKPDGDYASILAAHRAKRLLAQELKFDPKTDPKRIDDAIEALARNRIFDDAEEIAAAVCTLAEIGPPALPAICAELQHTSRPYARSGLSLALRAIDDPRAVPALIASLADCPFAPNDYGGLRAKDPALQRFMTTLARGNSIRMPDGGSTFDFGRPVNEINAALESLAGRNSAGADYPRNNDRKQYQTASTRWRTWWDQNGAPLVDKLPALRVTRDAGAAPRDYDPATIVANLKANPASANAPILDCWTPLHLAVLHDDTGFANQLLESGANPNAAGGSDWTPLHLAAALGRSKIVDLLLAHDADVNAKADDGATPFLAATGAVPTPAYAALPAPSRAVIETLLAKGADPRAADARGRTVLHGLAASAVGDPTLIRLLLDRHTPVDAKDGRGRTPLHRAVESGNDAAAEALLAAGADVNAKDATGRTPLRLAPYSLTYTTFNPPIVQKLLDRGAETDLITTIALGTPAQVAATIQRNPAAANEPLDTDDQKKLPLHWAITRKSPETLKVLLDAGADPNLKDKSGNAPVHNAAMLGDSKIVAHLLAAKADPNPQGQGDCTPLYWACTHLDVDVVNQLLAAGADPNPKDPDFPNPMAAVFQANKEGRFGQAQTDPKDRLAKAKTILVALLDHKADPNRWTRDGLFTSIYSASGELGEILLQRGAKLDVANKDGNTPLHYAAILGEVDKVEFLLKHDARVDALNKKHETPLHCATGYLHPKPELIKLLVARKPDLGAKDEESRTPLHRAIQLGSDPAARTLLEAGADPATPDKDGATAFHYAAKFGRNTLIETLLDYNALINTPDKAGRTPLDWATNPQTRAALIEHGATGK